MKILNISSYRVFPVNTGSAASSCSSIKKLLKEHLVTLLCCESNIKPSLENLVIIDILPQSKRKFYSLSIIKKIFQLAMVHEKIIIDYPWFGLYCIILKIFKNKSYDLRTHDIQFLRFKGFKSWFWPVLYLYEYMVYFFADKIIFYCKEDKELGKKYFHVRENKCIIEVYIADPSRFYPADKYTVEIRGRLNLKDDEKYILFLGTLDYYPNTEAIKIIKERIIPELNKYKDYKYKIIICGRNPPAIEDENILYTGLVDKIEHYIQSCNIMINPVISGGGVKTKVIEALACGKKVISTSFGARGIKENDNLIVTDKWDDFVCMVINL